MSKIKRAAAARQFGQPLVIEERPVPEPGPSWRRSQASPAQQGPAKGGIFFAGSFFMKKSVSGIGIFLSGALLAIAGFPEAAKPGEVPGAVLDRLALTYSGLAIFCGIAAALILTRFPITKHDHERRLADLSGNSAHGG